ncbi:MAG: alpha/beta hydrolase [Bacteroidota bacterium]
MNVYFISGLGADKRAFQKLTFPKSWTVYHIRYIENLKNEPLADYCKRLAEQIDTSTPFALVGLSFGGIIAVELNKIIQPQMTILISSISTQHQMPSILKISGKLKLHSLLPVYFIKQTTAITFWLFGAKRKFEKDLLIQIIHDTSPKFIKWAIGKVLTWKNNEKPENLYHIHGTADKLFPITKVTPDIKINGGGHFMVLIQAREISAILSNKLN